MTWATALTTLSLAAIAMAKPLPLEDFVQQVLRGGAQGTLPRPIGALIDLPSDAPYLGVIVHDEQTRDGRGSTFRVMMSSSSGAGSPTGLVLETTWRHASRDEGYWFRASLAGDLEKAVMIDGRRDKDGKAIKGSGKVVPKDVQSADIRARFKQEMDLWLKRGRLKKKWRSAEFSGGVLTTTQATP